MAGLMGNPVGSKGIIRDVDLNELINNGIYTCYTSISDFQTNLHYPAEQRYWLVTVETDQTWKKQTATYLTGATFVRFKDGEYDWSSWKRIDNFGHNTLAELAEALKPLLGLS